VRSEACEAALKRGARDALVVRYTSDGPVRIAQVSAAA